MSDNWIQEWTVEIKGDFFNGRHRDIRITSARITNRFANSFSRKKCPICQSSLVAYFKDRGSGIQKMGCPKAPQGSTHAWESRITLPYKGKIYYGATNKQLKEGASRSSLRHKGK